MKPVFSLALLHLPPPPPSGRPSILLRKTQCAYPGSRRVGKGALSPPAEPKSSTPAPAWDRRKGAPATLRPAEPNCPDFPSSQINREAGWRQQEANCTLSPLPHLQEERGGAGGGLGPPTSRAEQRAAGKPNLKLISFQRDKARPEQRKTFRAV